MGGEGRRLEGWGEVMVVLEESIDDLDNEAFAWCFGD